MKINNYSVMLNENRVPYLKLDNSVEYQVESELNNSALIVKMVNNIFDLEYRYGHKVACFRGFSNFTWRDRCNRSKRSLYTSAGVALWSSHIYRCS